MLPTIHQCLCEIVLAKLVNNFVEICIVCGMYVDRTVRQKPELALCIFHIILS